MATVNIENAMLATTTPDNVIEDFKKRLLSYRHLAMGKLRRPRPDKPEGGAK